MPTSRERSASTFISSSLADSAETVDDAAALAFAALSQLTYVSADDLKTHLLDVVRQSAFHAAGYTIDASEVADARALCARRRALVDEWDAGPEQREAWLHDYHAWLRALPPLLPEDLAGASVELRERVRLMEAAVLVQSEVLAARTTTKPLAAANSPRWRTTGSAKADLLRSVGADPGAVDELAAAAARARARANYEIM